MSIIQDEEEKRFAQPSFGCCGVINNVNVLALADTVDDIIPNNHISRYLKWKYETDSLKSDDEDDDVTIVTMNTNGNSLNRTLNDTFDNTIDTTVERSFEDSFDVSIDKEVNEMHEYPFDECIETWQSKNDSTVKIAAVGNPMLVTKGADNSIFRNKSAHSETVWLASIQNRSHSTDDGGYESPSSKMNTSSVEPLAFSAWMGEGSNDARQRDTPIPPSPIHSRSSTDKSDNSANTASNSSGNRGGSTKGGGGSTRTDIRITDVSVKGIGESVGEAGEMKRARSNISFTRIIQLKNSRNTEIEVLAKQKRLGQLKHMLQATEESRTRNIERYRKKRGKWRTSLKSMKDALQSRKKKGNIEHSLKVHSIENDLSKKSESNVDPQMNESIHEEPSDEDSDNEVPLYKDSLNEHKLIDDWQEVDDGQEVVCPDLDRPDADVPVNYRSEVDLQGKGHPENNLNKIGIIKIASRINNLKIHKH